MLIIKKLRKWYCVIGILVTLFLVIFAVDFYFLSRLSAQEQRIHKIKQVNQQKILNLSSSNLDNLLLNISKRIDRLLPVFLNQNPRAVEIRKSLLKSFRPKAYKSISSVWSTANAVSCSLLYLFLV